MNSWLSCSKSFILTHSRNQTEYSKLFLRHSQHLIDKCPLLFYVCFRFLSSLSLCFHIPHPTSSSLIVYCHSHTFSIVCQVFKTDGHCFKNLLLPPPPPHLALQWHAPAQRDIIVCFRHICHSSSLPVHLHFHYNNGTVIVFGYVFILMIALWITLIQ